MLSIDITDTRVSLICGSSNPKSKTLNVEKALTRELTAGCIENGMIKDIRTLAGEITELLVTEKISEREIVVLINSGLILFKEMLLPKPKKANPAEILERMIRNDMGLANDYNFTYSVVREEDANKLSMLRIMAVACPQRLVDGYVQLFKQLGLKLKAVYSANTCAVRLFSNTEEYKSKMPLVAIEVQNDFVNFNLFEDGKLTLSRFVRVDNKDTVNQTVFDNLFRIVQLFGQGTGRTPARLITYYGFTGDNEAFEQNISQFNIPVSRLSPTEDVTFNGNGEFSEYAVLVGSLYPQNMIAENINLLHSFSYRDNVANMRFIITAAVTAFVCACVLLVGLSYLNFHLYQRSMVLDSYAVEYTMLRPEELTLEKTELVNAISKFNTYSEKVELARELFLFQPKMLPDIVAKLRRELLPGMQISGNVVVNAYDVTASFICAKDDQPSRYTDLLERAGYFESIDFNGYQKNEDEKFTFTLKMKIKGGNRFEV